MNHSKSAVRKDGDVEAPELLDCARALAASIDFITEEDLCILAKAAPATVESWRRRGRGPACALIGNRFLYPRDGVELFLRAAVRQRGPGSVR